MKRDLTRARTTFSASSQCKSINQTMHGDKLMRLGVLNQIIVVESNLKKIFLIYFDLFWFKDRLFWFNYYPNSNWIVATSISGCWNRIKKLIKIRFKSDLKWNFAWGRFDRISLHGDHSWFRSFHQVRTNSSNLKTPQLSTKKFTAGANHKKLCTP